MIIKNIHIDGFGALKDKDYSFEDGLNIISSDNETGKTTIAEFIRAMLYGFDGRARDIRENPRKRYLPADGGVMGGRMEVKDRERIYIIQRSFGKTAASDKLSVTDSVTGKQLDVDPSALTGLDSEEFSKTLYIKQLSTKVEDSKDDQIRQRLINLCQTGDEELSYQSAMARLDDANKQLISRGKGLIPQLNSQLDKLHRERALSLGADDERLRLERQLAEAKELRDKTVDAPAQESREAQFYEMYEKWRSARQQEEEECKAEHDELYEKVKKELSASVRWATINAVIASLSLAGLIYFMIKGYSLYLPILLTLAFGGMCLKRITEQKDLRSYLTENQQYSCKKFENDVKYSEWFCQELGTDDFDMVLPMIKEYGDNLRSREKSSRDKAVSSAERVKELEGKIASINTRPVGVIDDEIANLEEKLGLYEKRTAHLIKAKNALEKAFHQTEQNFAPLITNSASPILEGVTDGAYTKLLSDNIYTLSAVKGDGSVVSGDYLSTGCYDQIYFALRIGIIKLMAPDMPIILDDAFAYYDDKRLEKTMAVLKSLQNQIILFSCHGRELNFK
ncbi:MAG: AAA family ATPase [Eubacteriales bacterium]|nr:AAA family ATPase [Eubacteriales bacterium]